MLHTMDSALLIVVLVVANVLGGAMAVPQAHKLLRTRSTAGVSATWAAIGATVNVWWGVYGIAVGDLGIVPVSVVSVMVYVLIASVIVGASSASTTRVAARVIGASVAVSAVPVIALGLDGWLTAGIALGALYGVQLSPAVVAVYRSIDVTGVALSTWVIALVEAALWGVYGLARIDVGIVTLAIVGVSMSGLVLGRLVVRRPRRQRDLTPAGLTGFATA